MLRALLVAVDAYAISFLRVSLRISMLRRARAAGRPGGGGDDREGEGEAGLGGDPPPPQRLESACAQAQDDGGAGTQGVGTARKTDRRVGNCFCICPLTLEVVGATSGAQNDGGTGAQGVGATRTTDRRVGSSLLFSLSLDPMGCKDVLRGADDIEQQKQKE